MRRTNGFPQAGIISSLNVEERLAKVFLPLFKIETAWIPVATNLLYDEKIKLTQIKQNTPYATTVTASNGFTAEWMTAVQETAPDGEVERIDYGTLKVGDEVLVVFLNADINQGRVAARF